MWNWRCAVFDSECGKAGIPFRSLTSADATGEALIIYCEIIFQWPIADSANDDIVRVTEILRR